MDTPERPEHLGPMARSLVETFADLTLPQQQRVFGLLREILESNERAAGLEREQTADRAGDKTR